MDLWAEIAAEIGQATGQAFNPGKASALGGGCINDARRLSDGERDYFVKTNTADQLGMFEAEAAGLALLREPGGVRVPAPICHGVAQGTAYLVLEFVPMGRPAPDGWARFGRGLATVHGYTAAEHGWDRDNTIGTTPQPNTPAAEWVAFFRERRLCFQLDLAAEAGHSGAWLDRGYRLADELGAFFRDYQPVPSLLHGDLWSGNADFDQAGKPVIYDPAVYFGDRETDLAMTELFGCFPDDFYGAYDEAWSIDPGYTTRRQLYQLYHILNHLNLFGGAYKGSATRLIDALLAQLR